VTPTGGKDAKGPIATLGRKPLAASGLVAVGRALAASVANSGDGTRTHDLRIMRPTTKRRKLLSKQYLRDRDLPVAPHAHHEEVATPSEAIQDDALVFISERWRVLSEPLKERILALVGTFTDDSHRIHQNPDRLGGRRGTRPRP